MDKPISVEQMAREMLESGKAFTSGELRNMYGLTYGQLRSRLDNMYRYPNKYTLTITGSHGFKKYKIDAIRGDSNVSESQMVTLWRIAQFGGAHSGVMGFNGLRRV